MKKAARSSSQQSGHDQDHGDALQKDLHVFLKRPRPGWILRPKRVARLLPVSHSKLGGIPYPSWRTNWPECPICAVPLNFVLQLHERQFPQMWFPPGSNLFQIFRCPLNECARSQEEHADRFTTAEFLKIRPGRVKTITPPKEDLSARSPWFERPLRERAFEAQAVADYPSGYEGALAWWGPGWRRLCSKYENVAPGEYDVLWSKIRNCPGIKIQGLPSWQQGGQVLKCSCGRIKQLVFQLASFDRRRSYRELCIGDAGNIYYFACPPCGRASLESRWDCG